MSILFIDTETTGKLIRGLEPDHDQQPRIVQLAAILADGAGKAWGQMCMLIYPEGEDGREWDIPAQATAVHGITAEDCRRYGVGITAALGSLAGMCDRATRLVAHNLEFDDTVLKGEILRSAWDDDFAVKLGRYCTMKAATPVLKIPGRYGDYKWPTLAETYRHFFGKSLEGAHDALADVRACMGCYFKLVEAHTLAAKGGAL